jgi:hypothetical protein
MCGWVGRAELPRRRAWRHWTGFAIAVAASSLIRPARSAPETPPDGALVSDPEAARRGEARRHFESGLKLYADGNFGGALAEFEAAYRLLPGAGAMQNIALCQKALFRYAEAADTLNQLLTRHGRSLDVEASRAVREAIQELGTLVGTLLVQVTPPDARVAVDGRALEPGELKSGVRLNVGEHTLAASAPGYAAMTRVIRVAGGQKAVTEPIALRATMGFVEVRARDAEAAIAVDGRPVAYHSWRGPLAAGVHLVQVYRPGFTAFERQIEVEVGKTLELTAELGPPLAPDERQPEPSSTSAPAPPKPRQQRGWYTFGTVGILSMPDEPAGLKHQAGNNKAKAAGGALGLRAGYRLWTPIAAELMLEWGRQEVSNACDEATCDTPSPVQREYSLATVRVGPNARLMSAGEKLRFSSTLGAGSVRHTFNIPEVATAGATPARHATGWNAYLMLELGMQMNLGNLLLGLDALAFVDATNNTGSHDSANPYQPYQGGLLIVGLGLRAGWSEWSPLKGSKLLQPTTQSNP